MSPMKKILSSTKEFIHKIFILLFSICVFSAALFFAGFIITVGTLFIFFAFDYLLGFVGINLTAIVLSILYGLGLPQNNTIYLWISLFSEDRIIPFPDCPSKNAPH